MAARAKPQGTLGVVLGLLVVAFFALTLFTAAQEKQDRRERIEAWREEIERKLREEQPKDVAPTPTDK